ncbi:MAG: hypothetical protein O7C98_10210 [Planctomycetota bacterium]|nr:hypothetical protein [Planctomycetota bacterium]
MGVVYEVDGQSADLGGIEVTVLETGERVVTETDGSFEFRELEPGFYTLDFGGDDYEAAQPGEAITEDELEDGAGHPIVELTEDGGDVEIHVALENGEVKEFTIGDYEGRHAVAHLHAQDELSELEGKIRLSAEEGEHIKLSIAGLDAGESVDLLIFDADDAGAGSSPVATLTADAEGEICYSVDTAEGDLLPLNAEDLEDLAGLRIEIRATDDGELLLSGEIPDLPAEREEPDGEEPDGEEPSGEEPNGEEPDGEEPNGEEPNGEEPDGEEPNGEESEGEGSNSEEGEEA